MSREYPPGYLAGYPYCRCRRPTGSAIGWSPGGSCSKGGRPGRGDVRLCRLPPARIV